MKIEREPFIKTFRKKVKVLPFEDPTGSIRCWSMGRQSAEEFCKTQGVNMYFPVFHQETTRYTNVKLYFPIRNEFFITTNVRVQGAPTLINILKQIEKFVQFASFDSLGYSSESNNRVLQGIQCCHLVVSRSGGYNKVYVRLTNPTHSTRAS